MLGVNAKGHGGWRRFRCSICATTLLVGEGSIYTCPKCSSKFCPACARRTHTRCPYCGSEHRLYL